MFRRFAPGTPADLSRNNSRRPNHDDQRMRVDRHPNRPPRQRGARVGTRVCDASSQIHHPGGALDRRQMGLRRPNGDFGPILDLPTRTVTKHTMKKKKYLLVIYNDGKHLTQPFFWRLRVRRGGRGKGPTKGIICDSGEGFHSSRVAERAALSVPFDWDKVDVVYAF